MKKSIKEIFWDIPEPEYRKDPALSQSILSTFERKGFGCLDTLFDHEEFTSLTFGSAVDALITGGEEEFNERFFVSDIPSLKPSVEPVVKKVYELFHDSYTNINDIPNSDILPIVQECNYQPNWKAETRCNSVKQEGSHYYQTMFMAGDKTILSQSVYNKVFVCVRALKDSPQTAMYFKEDDPFSDIERAYQQKFKGVLGGITYRGMADLLVVDHKNKVIVPCDLKTSSGREYDFPSHFIQWGYQCQARLYFRLIRQTMDRDEYFKDFKLLDFRFIVVNNIDNPVPLVWEFKHTQCLGDFKLGDITLRDPEKIGRELTYYLEKRPSVPQNISLEHPNSIEEWFNSKGYGK